MKKQQYPVKRMTVGGVDISRFSIVYPKILKEELIHEAELLAKMLQKATGHALAVMDDTKQAEYEIVLDRTDRDTPALEEARASIQHDGYAVLAEGKRLFITGSFARGTRNGIYSFLEEQVGFHFYTKDCIVIDEAELVEIPDSFRVVYSPWFEYRFAYFYDIVMLEDRETSNMYKLNGKLEGRTGDNIGYAKYLVHTLNRLMDRPHVNGEHPCLTDENNYQKVLKGVRKWLDENPSASIISVSQNDSASEEEVGCQCEKCRAINEAEESHMGTMLNFVNRIARDIREDYPGVSVDTIAYRYTRKPPKTIVPEENVIVRLCAAECDYVHPLADENVARNRNFKRDIEAWAKICKRLYVWDYTLNYIYYLAPYPSFYVLYDNVQFMKANNVVGLFEQGAFAALNGEFGEMREYLVSKLLWNPDMTREEYLSLMDGFLRNYYGAGWRYLKEYIDRITERAEKYSLLIDSDPESYLPVKDAEGNVDTAFLKEMTLLWDKALESADSETERKRIQKSRLQDEFFNLYVNFDHQEKRYEDFYNSLKEFGIKKYSENHELPEVTDFSVGPRQWYKWYKK